MTQMPLAGATKEFHDLKCEYLSLPDEPAFDCRLRPRGLDGTRYGDGKADFKTGKVLSWR